jgi:hypothetical protein
LAVKYDVAERLPMMYCVLLSTVTVPMTSVRVRSVMSSWTVPSLPMRG